jgi:outer membrane murein-binding lipoprotein Lpp
MSREVEELSSLYRKKVRDLTAALQERNREVEQLRAQRELLRAKKIHDVLAGVDKSADANTDIDAEFEIDTEKV